MPLLAIFGLTLVQGLTYLLPVGERMHLAVVSSLAGWGPQPGLSHWAGQLGLAAALLVLLHRELWGLLRGVWQLLRFRPREQAQLLQCLLLATIPLAAAKAVGLDDLLQGLARPDRLAATSLVMAVILLAADRFSMAIKRLEHVAPFDGLVLGLVQLVAFVPGVGLPTASLAAARILGFERPTAVRLAFLVAFVTLLGQAALTGWTLAQGAALQLEPALAAGAGAACLGGLVAASALLAWVREGSLAPVALYRLIVAGGLLLWLNVVR